MDSLPARLRAARKARGLTQRELAAALGVHPITVVRWETGARGMSKMAKKLVEMWITVSA